LSHEKVDDDAKFCFPREFEPLLCLTFDLVERRSSGEQDGDRAGAAIRGKGEIAGLLRDIERTPRERPACADVLGPGIDQKGEDG
jgi:hypothetical protein